MVAGRRGLAGWIASGGTLACGLLLASCTQSPTTPSALPLSAGFAFTSGPAPTIYAGSDQDSLSGAGSARVTVSTFDAITSGTWDMTFPESTADPTRYFSGELAGAALTVVMQESTLDGSVVAFTDCKLRFDGTLTSAKLTGTYASVPLSGCPARTGTIDLSPQ